MDKVLMNILLKVLPFIISQATPLIKDTLVSFILDMEKKAAATPNDFDNYLVDFLKALFNIPGVAK